jgi:hypothetical protein
MFPDGNLASLSDIQPGQRVRASYRVNPAGQYEAEEVSIMEMGPAASPPLEQGRGAGPGGDWKDY